ncbi:C-type lectin protein [Melanogaster broomeanus]|nr:C-type lectin protein [Melanogaster broomeanus]
MSPPSISRSSSSSDFGLSGTSSASSEFFNLPSKLFLLPPLFIDGSQLSAFASKLEKGYGDKILLSVVHEASCGHTSDLQQAMSKLTDAIPDARTTGKHWIKPSYFAQTTHEEALNVFSASGLRSIFSVSLPNTNSTLYCLERPQISFPPLLTATSSYSPFGPPAVDDWLNLWAAWDLVTMAMIPQEMLHQKPIDLRHKCLFYIGHIPTFLDMLMSRSLDEPNTEPKNFTLIFERGIDPHVDDPEHVHSHSEVPEKDEDWPTLGSILDFRDRVRARLLKLYEDFETGARTLNRHVARMLAMTHEHEGWHVETLLYMLIQRAGKGTLPPPGFTVPPWGALAEQWNATVRPPSTPTVTLGPATIVLGHEDCEAMISSLASPQSSTDTSSVGTTRVHHVLLRSSRIKMDWRPVTNAEFLAFYQDHMEVGLPPSWVANEDSMMVRTLYGPVSMAIAQHWPVLTSYDSLLAYATSKGGRLPTEPELRLFFDTYEVGHIGGANVGFRNWHPVPATAGLDELGGRGSNGGVWEWTSTLLSEHEGFYPTAHFPGYSTDFFDEKHHVVLGGSYATIPRLAGRRTARNFYQHNYPYPWVGARVVYDL